MTTPSFKLSFTRSDGWRGIPMPGAALAIEAETETDGQRPTLAAFVRHTDHDHDLAAEADRIIARSSGMPFHPLAVTEREIDGRPAVLAAGLRQHERLGVQFQTVAITRAAERTIVVTGLCSRAHAPAFAGALRDLTHSLRITEKEA